MWPIYSRKEFEDRELNTEYESTTGKKTIEGKKYKLYWSASAGGIWVEKELLK